jgi:hypothetical protein
MKRGHREAPGFALQVRNGSDGARRVGCTRAQELDQMRVTVKGRETWTRGRHGRDVCAGDGAGERGHPCARAGETRGAGLGKRRRFLF